MIAGSVSGLALAIATLAAAKEYSISATVFGLLRRLRNSGILFVDIFFQASLALANALSASLRLVWARPRARSHSRRANAFRLGVPPIAPFHKISERLGNAYRLLENPSSSAQDAKAFGACLLSKWSRLVGRFQHVVLASLRGMHLRRSFLHPGISLARFRNLLDRQITEGNTLIPRSSGH